MSDSLMASERNTGKGRQIDPAGQPAGQINDDRSWRLASCPQNPAYRPGVFKMSSKPKSRSMTGSSPAIWVTKTNEKMIFSGSKCRWTLLKSDQPHQTAIAP